MYKKVLCENVLRLSVAVATAAMVGACAVTERIDYGDREGRIANSTLHTISRQGTHREEVVGQLGMPASIEQLLLDDNSVLYEIYNYRFVENQVRAGHFLYLFKVGGAKKNDRYFHVVFRNDRVDSAWLNSTPSADMDVRVAYVSSKAHTQTPTPPPIDESQRTLPNAPEPRHVEVNTDSGSIKVVTEKTEGFDWKLPILKKWFGKKDTEVMEELSPSSTAQTPSEPQPSAVEELPVMEQQTLETRDVE